MRLFLGIDDTDIAGYRPGTGRLARELGTHLERHRFARVCGVVRHQLLVDPRIPYTSHNSPACLIVETDGDSNGLPQPLFDEAAHYVTTRCPQGADPGLCLAEGPAIPQRVIEFGCRASEQVVSKAEAISLAREHQLFLQELGGTGGGVIGALAAVGLTAEGNAGRFLDFAGGLRDFGDHVAAEVLRQRGIKLLSVSRNGEVVPSDACIATGDWVRPRLIAGEAVLLVEQTDRGWCCFDRKSQHSDHGGDQ